MKLTKIKAISILLLGVFVVLMLLMGMTANVAYGYGAIALVVIYGIIQLTCWKCPKCGKNLGPLWVKCCPNCGEKVVD